MRPLWTRLAAGAAVLVVAAVVLTQLFLPSYLEGRVEDRLTEHGGSAKVEIDALPAFLLAFDHGDEIRVRAKGLRLDLEEEREPVLDRLNGFGTVDVRLEGTRTGPFDEQEISITRTGSADNYSMVVHAHTTAEDLAAYAARRVGGGLLGSLATRLATGGVEQAQRQIPIDLDVEITPDGDVKGSVAEVDGLPLGPFAQSLADVVVSRL
jgi:hypothetical protein